jgi:hypothetical protein
MATGSKAIGNKVTGSKIILAGDESPPTLNGLWFLRNK